MNPSYNATRGANSQTQPQAAQNDVKPFVPRTHNYFPDMKHVHFKTQRYGVLEPFFCEPVVPGDSITLRNSLKVNSNPLQSPTLMPIKAKKVNSFVPMNAILPNTWDLIYKNPSQGDDIPSDANCVITNFATNALSLLNQWAITFNNTFTWQNSNNQTTLFKAMLFQTMLVESLSSNASLLSLLGYKPAVGIIAATSVDQTVDTYFDLAYEYIFQNIASFTYSQGGKIITIYPIHSDTKTVTNNGTQLFVTYSGCLDIIRAQYYNILQIYSKTNPTASKPVIPQFFAAVGDAETADFNFGALVAYQLSCFQFFVNSKVDSIYDSQIWLQAFQGLLLDAGLSLDTFEYNGNTIQYDIMSRHYMDAVFSGLLSASAAFQTSVTSAGFANFYKFFEPVYSLTTFNNALRFGDYFTGARTRALGVDSSGWTSAPVVANKVSAIDTTKSIIMQRFLNALVKIGNSVEEYRQMLTGKPTPPDFHYPQFISADDENITSDVIENNSDSNTGALVSRIYTNGTNKFEYTLEIDLHGFVIGLSYFYVPRSYERTKRRHFFHTDRYDMFNEMLQNIGDQPVYAAEIGALTTGFFGYQGRNEEYKQAYSVISGAFVDELQSWVFASDKLGTIAALTLMSPINSQAIRSMPSEFDRYMTSTHGLSLAHSYHFICEYYNESDFVRPMAQQPTIL